MKLYEVKETTPLAFYKFFLYVWLPVGIIGSINSSLSNLASITLNWYSTFLTISGFSSVVVYALLFWGLLKWKPFVFSLIIVEFILCIITYSVNILYTLFEYRLVGAFSLIAVSLIGLVITSLILLYFYKRRRLFDGIPYKIPSQSQKQVQPHYCVNCGRPIDFPNQRACPVCGRDQTGSNRS